jgi:hypothetical protein
LVEINNKIIAMGRAMGSKRAALFVSENYTGLTPQDVESLKTSGIELVTLYRTVNSKHVLIADSIKVENLAKKSNVTSREAQKDDKKTGGSNFIYILILIIVLGLGAAFIKMKKPK